MPPKRIFTFLNAAGIVLGILGLFLPWAEWSWVPGVYAGSNYLLGINIPFGIFTFWVWLVATISWVLFMITGQKLLLGFIMAGGIVAMICSLASLANPGALLAISRIYTASYGEYVSFTGGILILVSAAFGS